MPNEDLTDDEREWLQRFRHYPWPDVSKSAAEAGLDAGQVLHKLLRARLIGPAEAAVLDAAADIHSRWLESYVNIIVPTQADPQAYAFAQAELARRQQQPETWQWVEITTEPMVPPATGARLVSATVDGKPVPMVEVEPGVWRVAR